MFRFCCKLFNQLKTIFNHLSGLLGDGANLLELSNMLDGLDESSDDFVSKRRIDTGEEEDDEVKGPTSKASSVVRRPPKSQGLNNDVGDLVIIISSMLALIIKIYNV